MINFEGIKMSYTKITLIAVGLIILLMGIWGAVAPGWQGVQDPMWHAVLKIIVGLVAIIVGFMDKK